MKKNILVTITGKHAHKYLEDKAYIALLREPTGKFKYDRQFIKKQAFKNKYFHYDLKWEITTPGVYEMKEQNVYNNLSKTTYFAVNSNGDIIALVDKREVALLVSINVNDWAELSKFRIQIFKTKGRFTKH